MADVTIQDLGSLGELIAAIATVATLIYLAFQIRANTRSVRASSFQELDRGIREVHVAMAGNSELSRIWSS